MPTRRAVSFGGRRGVGILRMSCSWAIERVRRMAPVSQTACRVAANASRNTGEDARSSTILSRIAAGSYFAGVLNKEALADSLPAGATVLDALNDPACQGSKCARRFSLQQASSDWLHTGYSLPHPVANTIRSAGTPIPTKASRVTAARFSESARL